MPDLKVGDTVVYVDPVAGQHNALVTAVWGPTCINVVMVNGDESMHDSYGRQICRQTSVRHKNRTPAHGNYFMLPGEEPNPIAKAIDR